MILNLNNYNYSNLNNSSYLHPFFVGLLDGKGTISISKMSPNTLQVRIIISLLNNKENYEMLSLIAMNICGRIAIERNDRYVTWIAASKSEIGRVFAILEQYPLLTSRKICQYNFVKDCLRLKNNTDILSKWDILKQSKYDSQFQIILNLTLNFILDRRIPKHFSAWLSGFIEALGEFKFVLYPNGAIHSSQFVITLNYDLYILSFILFLFRIENYKISYPYSSCNNNSYLNNPDFKIAIAGVEVRLLLKNHFDLYPLLGFKKKEYLEWERLGRF